MALGGETDYPSFGKESLPLTVEKEETYLHNIKNDAHSVLYLAWKDGKIVGDASLEVRGDNKRAIHVYKKYGFRRIGTSLEYFKIKEEYFDFDLMVLDLREGSILLPPGIFRREMNRRNPQSGN